MPEMVAPRALVFRPLVKWNEALGTRLAENLYDLVFAENLYGAFFAENLYDSVFAENLYSSLFAVNSVAKRCN